MKNFVVIGGSSGIGKSLTNQLSNDDAKVFATYNATETESNSNGISYHKLNVLDSELNLDFLPDTIHGLAYCPGSINLKPFHRLKPESFVEDFKLQVEGAIKVIQGALKNLKAADHASIVLFSTVAVGKGYPFHAQVAASKGAIEGLTRSLAAELAPNIRVNCVAPSLTNTPLASKIISSEDKLQANADRHPLKRIGQPDDIANMAAFLLSDKSSWITGQVFNVDGGMGRL